jgi:MFS family permease
VVALARLVAVLALGLAACSAGVVGYEGIDRAMAARTAEQSVAAAADAVRWLVGPAQDRPPQQLARDLLARPVPPGQAHAVAFADGSVLVHPAGDPQVARPARTDRSVLDQVQTPVGPAWRATVPFVADGTVVGWYTIVEPFAAPPADRQAALADLLRRAAAITAGLALLGALGLGLRSIAAPRLGAPGSVARGLTAVVVEGSASRLAFGLLTFALPLYAYRLGMPLAQIGLLLSTNMAVAIALKPAMGSFIDRFGVSRSFILAVAMRTGVVLVLLAADSAADLFAARALHGVSIAIRDPAAATVLAGLGGKRAVAQRFAWYQTAKTVAGAAGAFLAGALLTATGGSFTAVFAVAALLSGLPLVVVLPGLRGPAVAGLTLPRAPGQDAMPADLRRALLPYAGLGAMMTGTAYLMANLLPVLAVEYLGLAPAAASSLYLIKAGIGLSGPVWGWVSDHVSLRLVLGVRAAGNTVSSLIWLLVPTWPGLVAGKIADDVGKAAFAPAWGAVMAAIADLDPARRARTLAWLSSAEDAGEMAGPVVAGVVWATLGLPAVLVLRVVLALGTEVWAVRLARRADVLPGPTHRGGGEPVRAQPQQAAEAV